jgi:integrase
MAARTITKTLVDGMQPGDQVFDSKVAGFGVRCQRAGRSYFLKTRVRGQQQWLTIGRHGSPWTVETARREARSLLGQVADGADPAHERNTDRAAGTVDEFCNRYLADYAEPNKKPRSVASDRSNIGHHVRPALGRRKLTDVGRQDIAKLHADMKATPGAANRCLALLSKMFNLAERWGLRPEGSNPVRHIDRYPERKLERFLSADELGRIGAALKLAETDRITPAPATKPGRGMKPRDGGDNPYLIAAIRLLLFTGARKGEILSAMWEHFDAERGVLRLPDSKTGAKTIALGAPALAVLRSLERMEGNPYVLPGHVHGSHLVNVDKFWDAVCSKAGVTKCRIHDLRHSFASVGAVGGDSLLMIGKLLGHTQAQTTQRYAHLSDDPMRAAADRISSTIAAAMDGAPAADVVKLKPKTPRRRRSAWT